MIYYLLLGLALGVAGIGFLVRTRSETGGLIMIVAGCAGCVACIGWQVRQNLFTPDEKGPDRGQAVVSYYLANQVLTDLGDQQGRITLFFPPESMMDEETVGTYAGTFNRVLRPFGRLQVQTLTLPIPRKIAKTGRIPLAAFQQADTKLTPAVAYVSFAGVPADIANFRPAQQSRFYVFDPWGTTNWVSAMKGGNIAVAIVPRPGLLPGTRDNVAGEPNQVFDQLYLMATRKTANEVAAKLLAR